MKETMPDKHNATSELIHWSILQEKSEASCLSMTSQRYFPRVWRLICTGLRYIAEPVRIYRNSSMAWRIRFPSLRSWSPRTPCGRYVIYLDFRSASTIAGRSEFMRLQEDASNHKFDIVLCKSISRFGRNVTEALQVINELHRSGIHVIFEQESLDSSNPEHTLLISIMSSIAEAEN